jgi:glucose/arabinose dehydrogenase
MSYIALMQHLGRFVLASLSAVGLAACGNTKPTQTPDIPDGSTGNPDAATFCERGVDVLGLTPPEGFCVKYYAQIGEPRSLSIAPNGDVFVGAPSRATSGGATGGPGAIMVLYDDNHDGIAEEKQFAGSLEDVHAVVVSGDYVYFTTQETVWRTPYTLGQRTETPGMRQDLGLPDRFGIGGRWTHGLARSVGGQLFTSRGEYGQCGGTQAGDISSIGPNGALTTIANGFRNPMYLRCHHTAEVCAATELGEDLTVGAREKLIMLRPGTTSNYGYPCCHAMSVTSSSNNGMVDCATTAVEDRSFVLQDTPFGLDWERGLWSGPQKNALFVALHGSAYSSPQWQGARIVYAAVDPKTHAPVEDWRDFLMGWGPGGTPLERPSDVAFAPDGRLFIADDTGGRVFWMAPKTLLAPTAQ